MKVDILAIGVHPDDVELCCSGTLLKHMDQGYTAGILDLTRGELGTRGTPQLRMEEANISAEIMGVKFRVNAGLRDGFFEVNEHNIIPVIRAIRKYRPQIVIGNALHDRHPDHGRSASLINQAFFLSGLRKVETMDGEQLQEAYRPRVLYHYIQDYQLKPDILVDVSPFIERKMKSILAFSSQFYNPSSKEPSSPISGEDFLEYIKASSRVFGRYIGVDFAEGFNVQRPVGVTDLLTLM